MKDNLRFDPMDQSAEGLIWGALSGLMTGIAADGSRRMAPGTIKPYTPPPIPDGRINLTDPDSKVVKGLHGWIQGYNAQAVTNEHQIVLAAEVMTAGVETCREDDNVADAAGNAAGEAVFSKARVINTLGNRAVHGHRPLRARRVFRRSPPRADGRRRRSGPADRGGGRRTLRSRGGHLPGDRPADAHHGSRRPVLPGGGRVIMR